MSKVASKPNYRAWQISEKDFPYSGNMEEKIRFLVGYGILAPSVHNTQPWEFKVKNDRLTISPDLSYRLPVGDPNNHGLLFAVGACAENIVQAASAFGLKAEKKILTNKIELLFTNAAGSKASSSVLKPILSRHSAKGLHSRSKLSKSMKKNLQDLMRGGVEVVIIDDPERIKQLAEIHIAAAMKVAKNKDFVNELSKWLRSNTTSAGDGMPGFVMGISNINSRLVPLFLRKKPTIMSKKVKEDLPLIESSGAVAVFCSSGTHPITQGMFIQRFWLKLVELGGVAHPMYASILDDEACLKLRSMLHTHANPIFVMRIGIAKGYAMPTPRRELKWS